MKTLKFIFRWIAFLLFMSLALVSCEKPEDITPPELKYLEPYSMAGDVSVHTEIIACYDEPVVADNLDFSLEVIGSADGSFYLPKKTVEAEVSTEGRKVILTPADSLWHNAKFAVHFAGEISDFAGNTVEEDRSWEFSTVGEFVSPYLVSVSPEDNADSVSIYTEVIIEFSEPVVIRARDLELTFFFISDTKKVATEISAEGNKYILTPVEPLRYNTEYRVFISNGITDLAGNEIKWIEEDRHFTTETGPWGLPMKYEVWSIGTNDNGEVFMGGRVLENSVWNYFLTGFDNQGELMWLKVYDAHGSSFGNSLVGPAITVTNDFIYLGALVDSKWRIDKYTVNGEKVWSSQPEWGSDPVVSHDSYFRIVPAEDGNLYTLRDFYNIGKRVFKLSSEGQLLSQVNCKYFYVSTMEATPYGYLVLFGQYGPYGAILGQLKYADLSWGKIVTFPSGTHMRLDGNNLFIIGTREVLKYELGEDGVNNEWSIEYTDTRRKVKDTDFDQDGNFYALVENREDREDGLSWEWIKVSPTGEIKATGIVRTNLLNGLIMFTVPRIAVTRSKVFVLVYDGSEWVFDLDTGTKRRIRPPVD